ncbi:MAG: diacylglycerol kinase family lipid kinase [Bacteroides sp.]|nr:diacylglycerol kinase family lipid kinase [Bacteroides sp.]MCM1379623.1 diacylglycerol kinase family lipid kinase [Bacteroides sp.]MCM1445995.1 diacylglycerol kinase family lipid kinase [Prevotella sp.]
MNRKANCLLIVNPRSGTSEKGHVIKRAIESLLAAGICVETAYTERPGHATELAAAAAAEGVDIVVAIGGDGTVNETARGLCNTSSTLGIIPMGSGNGLARHLNIPMDPIKAIGVLTQGKIEECDYCTVNDRPFFCTFGMGFDANVADRFASRPGQRGLINYVRSAIEEILHYKSEEYTIVCDNETLTEKAFLIACCNASQYGNNAYIAPDASIKDGLMDVTIFHSGLLIRQALNGIDMLLGTIHDGTRVHTFRTSRIVISRRNPGHVHLDGDPAQMGTRLVVRCHPGALRVLSPGETHVKPLIPLPFQN